MSEEAVKEINETAEQKVDLKEKINLDKGKNPEVYKAEEQSGEDLDALVKKKNELLNEKKREQQKNRQLVEELESLRSMFKRQEEEKLEEKQEYKTLWENTQKEKDQIKNDYLSLKNNLVREKKIKQFDKIIGLPLNKERYYDFVDLDSIIVEADGNINKDSVRYVANLFRENYPELTPRQNFPKVGSQSASNEGITGPRAKVDTKNDRKNLRSQMLRSK